MCVGVYGCVWVCFAYFVGYLVTKSLLAVIYFNISRENIVDAINKRILIVNDQLIIFVHKTYKKKVCQARKSQDYVHGICKREVICMMKTIFGGKYKLKTSWQIQQ